MLPHGERYELDMAAVYLDSNQDSGTKDPDHHQNPTDLTFCHSPAFCKKFIFNIRSLGPSLVAIKLRVTFAGVN